MTAIKIYDRPGLFVRLRRQYGVALLVLFALAASGAAGYMIFWGLGRTG